MIYYIVCCQNVRSSRSVITCSMVILIEKLVFILNFQLPSTNSYKKCTFSGLSIRGGTRYFYLPEMVFGTF